LPVIVAWLVGIVMTARGRSAPVLRLAQWRIYRSPERFIDEDFVARPIEPSLGPLSDNVVFNLARLDDFAARVARCAARCFRPAPTLLIGHGFGRTLRAGPSTRELGKPGL